MASFNKVILVGNLTRDPEVRYTTGGTAVTELGMAVSRQWTDKGSNERKEETTFVDVTLWGRTAEIAGEYLSKGRPVLIEGRLQLDQWEDRETGQKRSKLKVVGESMHMLGSRGDGGGSSGGNSGASGQSRPANSSGRGSAMSDDGDSGGSSMSGSAGGRSPDQTFYDDAAPSDMDDVPF